MCIEEHRGWFLYSQRSDQRRGREFSLQSTARDCTLSLRMLGFVSKKMECEAGNLGTILLRRETKPSDEEEDSQDFPPVVMNRDTMTYHIDHKPMEGRKRPALFRWRGGKGPHCS